MKTVLIVYFALVILALSACQKSNQDAAVPGMNATCVNNPNVCQTNIYQQNPGFSTYNYNGYNGNYYGGGYYNNGYYSNNYDPFFYNNSAAYLCNCPIGSVPTYNSYAGLGCVQSNQIYGSGYMYFGWGANNSQWTNIPQISNTVGYSNQSCYNGVIQSCLVDQANTCSVGFFCRAQSASSRIGLCVGNNNNSSTYGSVFR